MGLQESFGGISRTMQTVLPAVPTRARLGSLPFFSSCPEVLPWPPSPSPASPGAHGRACLLLLARRRPLGLPTCRGPALSMEDAGA